jgi:hypothetical protein
LWVLSLDLPKPPQSNGLAEPWVPIRLVDGRTGSEELKI